MSSFSELSIGEIRQAYRERRLTPLDVAQWCISAWRAQEHLYHAWECFDEAKMLEAAGHSTEYLCSGGPERTLEGIPVAVKDIFNTVDFPTQMGSPLWHGFTPGNDARAVFNLQRLGRGRGHGHGARGARHADRGLHRAPRELLRGLGLQAFVRASAAHRHAEDH